MKNIQPFRAIRYNSKKINVSNVICPPYDVIDEELADKLSKQDAHNSIYLSYNLKHKEGKDKYSHIPKLVQAWKKNKTLEKDSKPHFYFLEEKFKWKGKWKKRSGIFALIPVLKNKQIVPHEDVFQNAVLDRLALLTTSKAHISPIFLVYEDEKGKYNKWLEKNKKKLSLKKITFKHDSIQYQFGKIDDEESMKEIQTILKNKSLLIADGHHRFATAQMYSKQKNKEHFILAFIAPSNDLVFSYNNILEDILKSKKITTGTIIKACKNGKLMPQKSTYFYPKVMTGFVFSEL